MSEIMTEGTGLLLIALKQGWMLLGRHWITSICEGYRHLGVWVMVEAVNDGTITERDMLRAEEIGKGMWVLV